MLDRIKYINSRGETIQFGEFPYFANYSDFRNYEWTYESNGINTIDNIRKQVTQKSLPVVICDPAGDYAAANKMHTVMDYDATAGLNGKAYIGDWYLKGFFYGSEKADYLKQKGYISNTLKFVSPDGIWRKETLFSFSKTLADKDDNTDYETLGLDYPYDYSYDYYPSIGSKTVINSFAACEFRLVMYGPSAGSAAVTIGNNRYEVNKGLAADEYVIVDSVDATVMGYTSNGTITNLFSYRGTGIFEKIPTGESSVNTGLANGFDIILYNERSEPEWI